MRLWIYIRGDCSNAQQVLVSYVNNLSCHVTELSIYKYETLQDLQSLI